MRTGSDSSLLKIDRREIFEMPDGSGHVVRCIEGSLWITERGSSRDYVLGPRQSLLLDGRRDVVIQALRPSIVQLIRRASDPAPWPGELPAVHRHGLRI